MHLLESFTALLLGAGVAAANPIQSNHGSSHFDWDATKHLIAFGDSYTYVQGTHGYPNYSFIGDQLHYSYDAKSLLTDLIVQNQTGTAEGGPNWVEFITGCGLKEGFTSPLMCEKQLWDFAFAGSDISVEYTPLHHNFTVSLVNQVTQYQTYGYPVLSKFVNPRKTLVAVWIGINDVSDSAKYAVDFPTFYDELQTTLFQSIETLYGLGYRAYLFMNLPPLDRTPSNQKAAKPSPNATQVAWYNGALSSHAAAFSKNHSDAEVLVFDAHAVLSDIMDNPSQYGIVNTTDYCVGYNQPDIDTNYKAYGCPTPLREYFWFNTGHLTSHVHQILAGALEKTLRKW